MDNKAYLKVCNLKLTKGRLAVIDILLENSKPTSADFIYEALKVRGISVDLSTVYRTLETLLDKGVVEKFDLGNGKYNYALKDEGHKHILVCSKCHKELEIDCPMKQVEHILTSKTGFTFFEHDLKIKGLCQDCSSTKNK